MIKNKKKKPMKKFIYSTLTLALLASCQSINKESYNIDSVASPKGTEVFHPDWKNIADNYQFPEWFADAKFGIFIHWGPYSVPGLRYRMVFTQYVSKRPPCI